MNITLKTKMLGSVLLLAFLSVALAFIGISRLSDIESESATIASTSKKQTLTGDAQLQLVSWFRYVEFLNADHLDDTQLKRIRDAASQCFTKLGADLDALVPMLKLEQSRQDIAQVRSYMADYRTIENQAEALYVNKDFSGAESLLVKAAATRSAPLPTPSKPLRSMAWRSSVLRPTRNDRSRRPRRRSGAPWANWPTVSSPASAAWLMPSRPRPPNCRPRLRACRPPPTRPTVRPPPSPAPPNWLRRTSRPSPPPPRSCPARLAKSAARLANPRASPASPWTRPTEPTPPSPAFRKRRRRSARWLD